MRFFSVVLLALGWLVAVTGPGLAESRLSASLAADYGVVERFLSDVEKPPVAYMARRRLEASSAKLGESAWIEALTSYAPETGFNYSIVAEGGSDRIRARVLSKVLEAEKENSTPREWHKAVLSRDNYEFALAGRTADGLVKVQLNPRRRDSRLVDGVAMLAPHSGDLLKVEGRLSKSPSFWVRWVSVSRMYLPVGGMVMPASIQSTADVRLAGMSTFAMSYDYETVDGQAVNAVPRVLASR